VDPTRFDRNIPMGRGMAITASAGPVSNVLLALLAAVILGLGLRYGGAAFGPGTAARTLFYGDFLGGRFLPGLIPINVGLAVFNLLPVPPLDGSRIAAWLMPTRLREQWHAFERMAPFLLLFVFFFAGRLVSGPIFEVTSWLVALVNFIA
jgi:Zn-dependent protease